MRNYEIENAVGVMRGLDEEESETEEEESETEEEVCEDAPILLSDDVETDIEQDVMALEKKLKHVQEENERLLSEMLNEENISLERSIKTVNTEKERRNLLITLHSVMKSVRVARSRLRSVQVRNQGEQTVTIDTSTKRKLALQRAIYTLKQRIEDVRCVCSSVRRERTCPRICPLTSTRTSLSNSNSLR